MVAPPGDLMPDSVRRYLRLVFPAGICLLLLAAAAVFYGADIPAAKAVFSSAVIALAGVAVAVARPFRPPAGIWPILALLLIFAVQHVVTGRMDTAAPEFAALAGAGCIWLIAYCSAGRLEGGPALWRASLLAGTLIAVWAFIDFTLDLRGLSANRLTAGFLSPNTAATFFGIISLMGLSELLTGLRRSAGSLTEMSGRAPMLAISLVCVLVPATCLMLTASRGGIAFAALGACALAGWQVVATTRHGDAGQRSAGLGLAGVLAFAIVAGLVWTVSGELAAARFGTAIADTARQDMFIAYRDAIRLAPVSGHGLGSFAFTNDLIATSANADSLSKSNAAHNVFLQWLLQAGWTGALAMWAVTVLVIWQAARGLRVRRRHRTCLRAVICISAFVILHGLTDFALEVPGVMWWWAWVLGIGAGIAGAGRGVAGRRQPVPAGRTGSIPAARIAFVLVAAGLSGWAGWQGQMRVSANLATGLSPQLLAGVAQRDHLPPSAYLRDAYAARAIEADIADRAFAERATLAALEREPRLITALNRLVYLDMVSHGRLTETGQAALSRSFQLNPYGDREVIRWRLRIAASAWTGLSGFNRREVRLQLNFQAVRDRRWLLGLASDVPADFREEIEAALRRTS